MAYPYSPNSPIWSSDQPSEYYSPLRQYGAPAVAIGALGAAAYGATRFNLASSELTAFDLIRSAIRVGSESTPFAIMNTFRFAEFMSPLASPEAKGMTLAGNQYIYNFEPEFTKTDATKDLLKKLISEESFKKANIDLDLGSNYEFQFRQEKGKYTGSIFGRSITTDIGGKVTSSGEYKELASGISLMEKAPFESVDINGIRRTNIKSANPALLGVLQSMGLAEDWGPGFEQKAASLFANYTSDGQFSSGKAFVPVNPKNIPGGYTAFEMSRLNRLLAGTFEQIPILGNIAEGAARALGIRSTIQAGTAGKMFMRFGGLGAKVGAGIIGISQIDWARRNYGLPGEIIASGAISVGAAALTQKVIKSGSPRTAMMVGVASFFGQMLLPGFDQGVMQGIATTATKVHIGASALGAVTMMNTYRRTVEGLLPGFSSWETGALVGVGGIVASIYKNNIFDKLSPEARATLGLRGNEILSLNSTNALPRSLNQTKGEILGNLLNNIIDPNELTPSNSYIGKLVEDGALNLEKELKSIGALEIVQKREGYKLNRRYRTRIINSLKSAAIEHEGLAGATRLLDELHVNFEKSVEAHRNELRSNNFINSSYAERIKEIDAKYNMGTNLTFGQRAARRAEKFGATLVHSFFGSSLDSPAIKEALDVVGHKPRLGKYGSIFAVGFLAHQLISGGLLGSMEDPSELSDIYSGRQKVAVRRGRWWEGGGTPYAGGEIEYFKPHAYVDFMTRSREKSVWGADDDKYSPIRKFFLKNFTYHIEEQNYQNRPYPITGAAFEDIPIIGGLLAATIGRVIKPPKLMHTSEYMRMGEDGNIEFLHRAKPGDPSSALGGTTPGTPISPFSSRFTAGQLQYQYRELAGITGFAQNLIQQTLTGTQTFETQKPVLASAGLMTDPAEAFWDLNIGGGFFTTEAIRRFLPRKQSEIGEYNPLQNNMPYWMPDRFKYGDPYRNVKQGYMRMPGAGYEAIHPELAGFSMEEYPDIYKYSILADVAPMSKEFMQVREKMYKRRSENITSESENALMDSIDTLYNERLSKITMDNINKNALEIPGLSRLTQSGYGFAQKAIRKGVAPVEYMIPAGFRPIQKLMSDRDMIEQYEYERMYGNQFAFWDKPYRDWFRPAFYSVANLMGYEGKPLWRREVDSTQEYFDRLQFQKSMQLAQQAAAMGDNKARRAHLIEANKTRYGINPQSSAMSIYMSLPESEKRFFDAFSSTTSDAERKRILEMVPKDHVELYKSVWSRSDAGDPSLYVGSVADYDVNQMNQKFYDLQAGGLGGPRPPVDWIGWRDDVELDDIQLKYIDNLGKEIHDYGFWESQRRDLARREYLEGSDEFLRIPAGLSPFGAAGILYDASRFSADQRLPMETSAFMIEGSMQGGYGQMYYNDDRSFEYAAYLRRMNND